MDLESRRNELSYNLIVIKALWKSVWNNYGEGRIKGHEYDFNSLYRSIEKGKETIRLYIQGDYTYKETSINNWAKRIEAKTGIPHEYLTGAQRIKLGKNYEDALYPIYTKYLHIQESASEKIDNALEEYELQEDKDSFPDFDTTEEIKQFVKSNYTPEEQKEFFDNIKDLDEMERTRKQHAFFLAKEAARITRIDTAELMQQDEKLCKLVYFIRFKKKYDGISIRNINDIKKIMKETRTQQLERLGKKGLEEYIKILEEHLNLAKSVYTVAIDCGSFQPNNGKK